MAYFGLRGFCGAYRGCGARFWFWRGFWGYGSHRLTRYRLRLRSDNFLSAFDISAHILCAFNIIGSNYLLANLWRRFRLRRRRYLRARSGVRQNTTKVKQSRIQLRAIARYNINKSGERASIATFAKVLCDVALIRKVNVFIVPSNLKCLLSAN